MPAITVENPLVLPRIERPDASAGSTSRPIDRVISAHHAVEGAGFEVDDVKDAKNTFAVFLRGPEGVRIEYVEHKPGFALV